MKSNQLELISSDALLPSQKISSYGETRLIETPSFPFEKLSVISEVESWRKEIYRPNYHIHKWWAQRLGSVFRAIIIGTFARKDQDLLELFYSPLRLPKTVIWDPFMGSGTTVGEGVKVAAQMMGRDINPVSYFIVKTAFSLPDIKSLHRSFHEIESEVAHELQSYYQARLPNGDMVPVLYYFWVKFLNCPRCSIRVDLFSSYVFASHVYPKKHPDAQIVCPFCGSIESGRYDAVQICCSLCNRVFDPQNGSAHGAKASCLECGETFAIAEVLQRSGHPPQHRMYAKMVLLPNGDKKYLGIDDFDVHLYDQAVRDLKKKGNYPQETIAPGYNTNQVLNYCYRHWHQMFNARQLVCLSILADKIRDLNDKPMTSIFSCLFSGMLEFNNMFASYKGEGTGAVRHMFSHHVLKPEKMPLEANIWGTPRSSRSFSTLFKTRVLRAAEYCERPFEARVTKTNGQIKTTKIFGLSQTLRSEVADSFADFKNNQKIYLSCGDSSKTDIESESVDAIITDPPFFDNVHYSELADFFYVWQRNFLEQKKLNSTVTTRNEKEVQQTDPVMFTERLTGVWKECHRVLKEDGLMVFTYHHSRVEGWSCILESLMNASFRIVRAHPIKSELSVAAPKHQAKNPIDIDMILVCRKRAHKKAPEVLVAKDALKEALSEAEAQIKRLKSVGRMLSTNDARVILTAQVLVQLTQGERLQATTCFEELRDDIEEKLHTVLIGKI